MRLDERRRTRRRSLGENRAAIEWNDRGELLRAQARLVDISQGGARFVAEGPPPAGRDVWFRLESPRMTGWVSARIVRIAGPTEGSLAFSGYCPHELIAGLG